MSENSNAPQHMNGKQRILYIQENIKDNGHANIEEIARKCNVSPMTIRRDLRKMDEEQRKIRGYKRIVMQPELPYQEKKAAHSAVKQLIAKEAAAMVKDDMRVYLDAGTTTYEIAALIGQRNIQIVTNDLKIAASLEKMNASVYVCGGLLQKETSSLLGSFSLKLMENMRFDLSFISSAAIDDSLHSMSPNSDKAFLKQEIIKLSAKSILVVDASKFHHSSYYLVNDLNRYNAIITDYEFSTDEQINLASSETEVISVHLQP